MAFRRLEKERKMAIVFRLGMYYQRQANVIWISWTNSVYAFKFSLYSDCWNTVKSYKAISPNAPVPVIYNLAPCERRSILNYPKQRENAQACPFSPFSDAFSPKLDLTASPKRLIASLILSDGAAAYVALKKHVSCSTSFSA